MHQRTCVGEGREVCLDGVEGFAWWNEGQHLDRPAIGADGERDFGGIDVSSSEGDVDHLEGD